MLWIDISCRWHFWLMTNCSPLICMDGYGLPQYGFMFDESSLTFIDTEYIMSGLCNLYLQSTSPFIYFYQFLCSKKIKIYIYIIYPSEPPNPSLKKRQAIFKFWFIPRVSGKISINQLKGSKLFVYFESTLYKCLDNCSVLIRHHHI